MAEEGQSPGPSDLSRDTSDVNQSFDDDGNDVPLKDPFWAAILAWLLPGAGHFYQRRFLKGVIFSVTILAIYVSGVAIGGGQVVYASWRPNDHRWQFACQMGVGLPAMPAVAQYFRTRDGQEPFFANRAYFIDGNGVAVERELGDPNTVATGPFSPPPGPVLADGRCVLAIWHEELGHRFEIGTLYTVVAGLLNLLAVYDAFAGPAFARMRSEDEDEEE